MGGAAFAAAAVVISASAAARLRPEQAVQSNLDEDELCLLV